MPGKRRAPGGGGRLPSKRWRSLPPGPPPPWREREAEALFTQYKDDAMASWAYSGALLDFRKSGDSPAAREALAAAVGNNKHVPAYLLGHRKVPGSLPPYHGVGDDSEAIVYVHGNRSAWKATSGALEWLAAQVQ